MMKDRLPLILTLSGASSWLLIIVLSAIDVMIHGSGCMSGLRGLVPGLELAIAINTIAAIALFVVAIIQLAKTHRLQRWTVVGLAYYGIAIAFASAIAFPSNLMESYIVPSFRHIVTGHGHP